MNLRERLAALEMAVVAHDRADERRHQADEEVRVAAYSELQRRLEELNHAHAEAVAKESTFLPREMYEARHAELVVAVDRLRDEMTSRVERLDRAVDENRGRLLGVATAAGQSDRSRQLIFGLAALVVSVVVVSVSLYFGFRNRPPTTVIHDTSTTTTTGR